MFEKPSYKELEKKVKGLEQEVAKRKHAEEALRESERKYHNLFENGSDLLCIHDLEGNFLETNLKYKEQYGLSNEDLRGMNIRNFIPDRYKSKFDQYLERIIRNGEDEGNLRAVTGSGDEIVLEYRNKLIHDSEGGPVAVQGSARDVTSHIKARKAQKESEERYIDLFERSLDCIYIHDFEGNFIDLNPAALKLIGYTKEEITYLNFISLLDKDSLLKAFNDVRDIMAKSVEHGFSEYKLKKKNGDYVYIETKGTLIYKDGKSYSIMGIARDITERKQAEEKLMKLHEELEERVEKRTRDLAEANTALQVLLKRRGEDQTEIEEKILSNVNELITPVIDTLKQTKLDDRQSTWLEILKENLSNIVSPFSRTLHVKYWRLAPMELQVANLIRNGKSTKEIAKLLCVAQSTVNTYRDNIRKKLGIKNKKINLKTYLFDLE